MTINAGDNQTNKILILSRGDSAIKIVFAENDNAGVLDIILENLMTSYEERISCEKNAGQNLTSENKVSYH